MADYKAVPLNETENIREMEERQAASNTDKPFEMPKLSKEDWVKVNVKVEKEGLSYSEAVDKVKAEKLIENEEDGNRGTDPLIVMLKEWPKLEENKDSKRLASLEYLIGRLTKIILEKDKGITEVKEGKEKKKKKYNEFFRDDKDSLKPTLLHMAAKLNYAQVSKMLVEHSPKLMYAITADSVLPLQVALRNFRDDTASYLISRMQYDRVQQLFLHSKGKKPKDPSFGEIIGHRDPKMKKTVTAVLNKLIDPVWPYLPNREDREESGNRNDITKALESVPNDPLDYDFYYHILETDDNGNVPDDDSNFNKESVSCLRHIADCSTDDKEAVQHPVVRMLAVKKWKKFGFWWFCFEAALYALFFTVLSFALIYGSTRDHPTRYEGPADIFRALCEICSIIFLMVQFVQMIFEIAREKSRYFDFFNCINILSMIILILFVIPLRFVESNSQWLTAAIGYLLCFIHLFKYSNVSRITGLYTTTIVKMIMEDVKRFMLFFAVIFIGFCGTMFLALKVDGTQDSYSFSSIMLGGFKALVGQGTLEEDDGKKFGWLASVVLLVYMGVLTVMLLNILIAQFGFTYAEARKTARIQYAADIMRIVTRLEYSRFERWNYRENTYEPGAKMTDEELAEEMLESTEGRHPWETDEEKIGSVREAMKRVLKTDRGKEKDPLETVKEELMQSINEKFTSLTAMMEQMKKESEQMKKESQPSE